MGNLKDKTVLITGASRGIGREIALRCARDGANIVILAKTAEPDPKLPGTIYTVAEEIETAGGKALPRQVDIRDETLIEEAVKAAVESFGGIDIVVNNASAISVTKTIDTPMKRFDLLFAVNVRATFATSQACIPYLQKAENPHILMLAPPLNMNPKWFKNMLAYTMSKYGMSMCTLGLAAELADDGIAVNSLWPKYVVETAAIKIHFPTEIYRAALKASIVADAAYEIITSPSRERTGNFYCDVDVLKQAGITDLEKYARTPGKKPYQDFYID